MKSKMLSVLRRYVSISTSNSHRQTASHSLMLPNIAYLWQNYWQEMNQIFPEDRAIRFLDLKSYLIHKGIPVRTLNSGYIFNMEKGQYSVRNFYGIADIGVFIVDSMNPEGKSYNSMQFKMSTKALYKKLVRFDEMWDIAQMKMTDVYFLVTQEEMVEKIEETTRIASLRTR